MTETVEAPKAPEGEPKTSPSATDSDESTIDIAEHFEVAMQIVMAACGRAVADGWQGFPSTGACLDIIREHDVLVRDAIAREDAPEIVSQACGLAAVATLVAVQALIASGVSPEQARAQLSSQNGVSNAPS